MAMHAVPMSDARDGDLRVSARVIIPASELSWTAVRASGPGGQNVNKVASKVDLRFDLANTASLPSDAKARLRFLAGAQRLDAHGRVVITSQLTRDQPRNLEDAREKLRALIARALVRPKPRHKTKPTRSSQRRRVDDKRRRSQVKAGRKNVRDDD
jgi:ribosome-associated protein